LRRIRLKFTNGLAFADGVRDILFAVRDEYEFVESDTPEVVIFGPYGSDIPPPGGPVRVGYFCENIRPDLSICDWAFGIPYEELVGDPRYMRIEWHGVQPQDLAKPAAIDPEAVLRGKTRFCNFLYGNPVPYRERFFRELSRYKRVDAPGRSMNNMPGIDSGVPGDRWSAKRQYLQAYKFTIAFENYSFPGYHSEKLLDPMLAASIPVYFGNPRIASHFNPRSFLNGHEYVRGICAPVAGALERLSLQPFRGHLRSSDIGGRVMRRIRGDAARAKMRLQCWDFGPLIEAIARLDQDDDLYLSYVAQPWFVPDAVPAIERSRQRWRRIFSGQAGEA